MWNVKPIEGRRVGTAKPLPLLLGDGGISSLSSVKVREPEVETTVFRFRSL
jgi:hypothetical protein